MKKEIAKIIECRKGKLINIFFDLFLSPAQQRREFAEYPNMADYETLFQVLMETAPIQSEKKSKFCTIVEKNIDNVSSELFKLRPLDGFKILEIGGYFSINLGKLGAISEKMDAAVDENEYITLQNYKNKLHNKQYDITLSKEVFDRYSEIENGKKYVVACQELLTVFSRITRKRGISIHEGRMDEALSKTFLKKIGFTIESIFLNNWCNPPFKIYVFRKK